MSSSGTYSGSTGDEHGASALGDGSASDGTASDGTAGHGHRHDERDGGDVRDTGREGEYQDREVSSDSSGRSRVADTSVDSEALDDDVVDDGEFTDKDVVDETRPEPVEGSFVDKDVTTDASRHVEGEGSFVDRDLGSDGGADGGARQH